MKGKITNNLKPQSLKKLSEVGYSKLSEMPGKKTDRLLKVSHKVQDF